MALRPPLWVLAISLSALLALYLPAYSINQSLSATFVVSYLILLVAKAVYWVILYPDFFTPFKHLPTPPGRSIWNGHNSSVLALPPGEAKRQWLEDIPNNGLIRFYQVLNTEALLPTTPEALREVLTHKAYDFQKPETVALFLSFILGNGILLAEGDVHKTQRRNLNPAFSFRHVKNLYPTFWQKAVEMVDAMEKSVETLTPGDRVVNIGEWASRVTLDIIGLTGLGQDFNALRNPNNALHQQYENLFTEAPTYLKIVQLFFFMFAPRYYYKVVPAEHNRTLLNGSKYLRDISRRIIREKKEKMEKKEASDTDIISVAIESGLFTEDNLVDQVMTFLAAGHETTSTALQWSVYALCKHPDIQKKLREEIRSTLPSVSDGISASQIDSMTYLNAFCNESLRYYPPARNTVRVAARDTSIQGTFVRKGTFIVIVPYGLNHNTELWGQDASEFKPERWLSGDRANAGGAHSNYAFLTFLHGPRSCIAASFARAELACLIAAVVGKFELELEEPDKELEYFQDLTTKPKGGLRTRIRLAE